MISKTLEEGLRSYEIGEKLRGLRLRKKMGLVELGRHTGLSPALLSKIERSRLFPTLPTLQRIALVFGVGLEYFFQDERRRRALAVVRRAERQRFPDRPGTKEPAYFFESLDYTATERKLSAFLAEFQRQPAGKEIAHQHYGVEFLYLLEGTLTLEIKDDERTLEAGDSIYFDSSVPHSYRRVGKERCSAVVVTVP